MSRPTLAISQPLRDWLRQDPTWDGLPWTLRAQLNWRALLGSINTSLSPPPSVDAEAELLFIAGPWRSGTTVMHELITAALGWTTPQTWQCMDPTAFRLRRAPKSVVAVARPMDGLQLGALSPQEDEFALLGLGIDSAYRAFWMPHRLSALHHTLDPAYWQGDRSWLNTWQLFIDAVRAPSAKLILKSPNHSFRMPALLDRYPNSKWIWMLRDGRSVFASNRKMWGQMFATHGLSVADPDALDRFLAQALTRCAELLESVAMQLPPARMAFCQQTDLRLDPAFHVQRVLGQLGLKFGPDERAFADALRATAQGRLDRYPDLDDLPHFCIEAIERFDAAQRRAPSGAPTSN